MFGGISTQSSEEQNRSASTSYWKVLIELHERCFTFLANGEAGTTDVLEHVRCFIRELNGWICCSYLLYTKVSRKACQYAL